MTTEQFENAEKLRKAINFLQNKSTCLKGQQIEFAPIFSSHDTGGSFCAEDFKTLNCKVQDYMLSLVLELQKKYEKQFNEL